MSFIRPYQYESEPSEPHAHDLAFIALGIIGTLQFNWDVGNQYKNEGKHGVSVGEIEKAMNNKFAFVALVKQAKRELFPGYGSYGLDYNEDRFLLFSLRDAEKYLMVVFTLRSINGQLAIRPISARYIKEKEMHKHLARNGYNWSQHV